MYGPRSAFENWAAERILVAVGAALIIVSPYLPWIHVVILGDVNLTQLLAAAHSVQAVSYVVSAVGLGLLLVAVLARSMQTVRVWALTIGSVVLLFGGYATYGLIRAVSASAGLGAMGIGPIMAVVGSVLLIVPPIVGFSRAPVPYRPPVPLWRSPAWTPTVVAALIGLGLAWLPFHSGVRNYCGTAVGVSFKSPEATPSSKPPQAVQARFQYDQAAVAAAQSDVAAQQASDGAASQQQSSADALIAQAQQADSNVNSLEQTLSNDEGAASQDQGTLSGDQGSLEAAKSTVQDDQATVASDQQNIAQAQAQLQTDQQQLQSDQSAGLYTGGDQFSVSTDQQNIAQYQATLGQDQATLQKDQSAAGQAQNTVKKDQAALNQAEAIVANDQQKLAAAQQASNSADAQAQSAQDQANSAAAASAQADQAAQQQLQAAQQQLSSDTDAWQARYQAELDSVHAYNASLSSCQSQASDHFVAATAIGVVGGLLTSGLLFRRKRYHRASPDPGTHPF